MNAQELMAVPDDKLIPTLKAHENEISHATFAGYDVSKLTKLLKEIELVKHESLRSSIFYAYYQKAKNRGALMVCKDYNEMAHSINFPIKEANGLAPVTLLFDLLKIKCWGDARRYKEFFEILSPKTRLSELFKKEIDSYASSAA